MTHSEAVENKLAEKYLLSELDESEREQFEIHFFSCPVCAADLNDGALFVDAARGMLERPRLAPVVEAAEPWWSRWLPRPAYPAFALMSTAVVVLSGVSVVQWRQAQSATRELAEFREPRQVPAFVLHGPTRGPVQTLTIPPGAREVELRVNVSSEETFKSYRAQLDGVSVPLTAPPPGNPIQILVPTASLGSGEFSLRIFGVKADASESEIATHKLKIQESP